MTKRIFGHVPGVAVGTSFASYAELNGAGVRKQTQAGISGSGTEGAESVVVSGGYPDDQDSGDEIIYTGQGGRDTSGKHVKDQELVRGNLALAKSELEGLPVRIIRGAHPGDPYAPKLLTDTTVCIALRATGTKRARLGSRSGDTACKKSTTTTIERLSPQLPVLRGEIQLRAE